ncbi:MAG: isopentenyl-diphosphate delta-isomerase [Oligoflexia bacterium]|nr:isopentenyl-diphosphate delta-isomerase [Oligoflexia bacterium]MBF0366226.1 isopentenyl-diphosphate delta-isomerase [Oligoflexia bacterium]
MKKIVGDRKMDHLKLVELSQLMMSERDGRFDYEPMLGHHGGEAEDLACDFLGYRLQAPIWISSMTGGSRRPSRKGEVSAGEINLRLARAVKEFGLGMSVGSCRRLLEEDGNKAWGDFDLREIIGEELPFYANLGVAQLEEAIRRQEVQKIVEMVERLRASGLVVHVNPLQEWFQPEGDRLEVRPLETLQKFLQQFPYKVIVKEVGQGMGPRSVKELLKLPLAALECSGFGGTNFSRLELLRAGSNHAHAHEHEGLVKVGHSTEEMVALIRNSYKELSARGELATHEFILSGGVRDFLDGHFLMNRLGYRCVFGFASGVLLHARKSYGDLQKFLQQQIVGLKLARQFLYPRESKD